MVSVNEDGKPMEVPRLTFESDVEEKLFEAGKMRCAMRKEIQARNKKITCEFGKLDKNLELNCK